MSGTDAEALGRRLARACEVGPGKRVLDVASGPVCAWLAAARRGADVVASQHGPTLLAGGRARAAAAGVAVEWVLSDLGSLPFADATFEIVMTTAPALPADELMRVLRPGGTIGLLGRSADSPPAQFGVHVAWTTLLKEKLRPDAPAHLLAIGTRAGG